MEHALTTIALIGVVIIVASLLSGVVERSRAPVVGVFLALGAAIGPWGLGLVDIQLDSSVLRVLATLGLALVLFSDAVTVEFKEVRARKRLVARLLGPGTLLPAAVIALAAWWLLRVPVAAATLLGAALASTDPVLLRSVLRSRALPPGPRVALRLESGMNDALLLPIVVFSMLILQGGARGSGGVVAGEMARHAVGLFLLGPALGALVGWLGIVALARVRDRFGVRRDYESLYALGLAFTGYAAAEMVGGSGFLAAFAAGLMVASQDVELCDCFLEYGEATAEMLLLLTFVALGMSLIWTGLGVIGARTLLFAVIALAARTVVLLPVLRGVGIGPRDCRLIALFGPRGLSSLLFTLLPVFAGVPGSEYLFTIACLVVLLSVALHGSGIALFLRAASAPPSRAPTAAPPAAPAALPVLDHAARAAAGTDGAPAEPATSASPTTPTPSDAAPERMTITELRDRIARGETPVIVDARADRSFRASDLRAQGSVRVLPDDPVRSATEQRLSKHATLVVYCA
ncbi:MAG TPA: cation:proton antiporter [Gemmatimonadaceae bacterium]